MDDDWILEDLFEWDELEDREAFLYDVASELASLFFLSNNAYLPDDDEEYRIGYLDAEDWWPLAAQLDELLDLETLVPHARVLEPQLRLPGLPTELLEDPLAFLEGVLEGDLPPEPSGRKVGSRRLIQIALSVVRLLRGLPQTAQAAVRAWADVQRRLAGVDPFEDLDEEDLADLLFSPDLPPAMTGFLMVVALTLMHWPERAEGLPLPPGFATPDLYDDLLVQWEALPASPSLTEDGQGEAEALFAQGQLAHLLAQMGSTEQWDFGRLDEADMTRVYSRLSRAALWLHDQCRSCPEREGVACAAATFSHERPVPLLDVAGEMANSGRIEGCIKLPAQRDD